MSRPSNNPQGRPSRGLCEAQRQVRGPAELLAAMDRAAQALGISSSEAWRRAAFAWLASLVLGRGT